jgi:threonine dehydratase
MSMKVSIADIKNAHKNIQDVIRATEIEKSYALSNQLGSEVFLKFENQQFTGSFKLRGAYNKISSLSTEEKKRGVICCSAGNHAQGVAFSSQKAGVKAKVVMPITAPLIKIEATRGYGAEVVLHGEIYDEAQDKARELEKEFGYTFVHPYEDERIIAGQGTIGLEICERIKNLESVVVPVGGGGLISGIAIAVKSLNPKCRIIGVQSAQSPGMSQLFHKQSVESLKGISTIADGIAIKRPSQLMYDSFIHKYVDEIVTVTDDEIAEAMVLLIERAKVVTEGAGAVGVAAIMNHKLKLGSQSCVILSGGNIDLNIISKVIEKGQIRKGRLVELSAIVDDVPGTLSRLTKVIADCRANVLEVNHDRISQGLFLRETRIDFVLETKNKEHVLEIKKALEKAGGKILIK